MLGCGRVGDIVRMLFFFRDLLFSRHSWKDLVMMSGKGSAKTVDSIAPKRGFCAGRGQILVI